MLNPSAAKIYLCLDPTDMRKSFDTLTATCQQSGVNPWTWLKDALARLPITPTDQLATLLPVPPQ